MTKLKEFPYQNILVLGLAKSGTVAAKTLLKHKINVRVNDIATEKSNTVKELEQMGAEVIVGSHPLSVLNNIDLIIKNPGIPYENIILKEAQNRQISIVTEIELAYYLVGDKMIGITGSNGKTTTTTLTGKMLESSKLPVKVAGNIGEVATNVAETLEEDESLVLELSSFQLQGTIDFKPKIAVLLNLYEAHLDFHHTFENYIIAKSKIFKNQTSTDYLVYNADDPIVSEVVKDSISVKIPFSTTKKLDQGAWASEEYIYYKGEKIISKKDIVLVGEHNIENILAAICTAKLKGATNEGIRNVLTLFTGVKHRLQYVETINNRLFYNDSKATNILAAEKALASFAQPVILLAGGLDRGNRFDTLIPSLKNVKAMIVFGETAEKLIETANEAGITIIKKANNVEDATTIAYDISEEDDIILLSPACASWDQYKTFEERGNIFIQAINTLKQGIYNE